jgi:hypothetical protein
LNGTFLVRQALQTDDGVKVRSFLFEGGSVAAGVAALLLDLTHRGRSDDPVCRPNGGS